MSNPNASLNVEPYRFAPGVSGNPGGRPREVITPLLRKYAGMTIAELREHLQDPRRDQLTAAEVIAIGMLVKAGSDAMFGDKTRDQVIDRLDGKVQDSPPASVGKVTINYNVRPLGAARQPERRVPASEEIIEQ